MDHRDHFVNLAHLPPWPLGCGLGVGERPISLFIVTPVRLYRDGIAHFLRACGQVDVLGSAEENTTTVLRVLELAPDVVLLDMALPDSRQTARALHAAVPATAVVALAVPESEGHVVGCAEAGIAGYVPREGSLDELLEAVVRAAHGEAICSPRVAGELLRRIADLCDPERPAAAAPTRPPS